MKILITALLSAALILLLPGTPVNKSTTVRAKAQTVQAVAPEKATEATQAPTEQKTVVEPAVLASNPVQEPNTPDAWMQEVGLSDTEKQAAMYIIGQESGWCPTKWQGQYGTCPAYHGTPQGEVGYGLCQATPASKMASAGADWATNPITQLKWCNGYVQAYGGWEKAADFKRCTGLCFSPKVLATVTKRTPWF